jgi:flagellar protein FlaI
VGLFDLVKAAMRMRPDILVVGEVRGEEAYVLFQAISTGHGGLCTLHADDAASALQRLVSEPMNVPRAFIPFLDLTFVVRRISVPAPGGGFKAVRRIVSIDEIVTDQELNKVFRWDPRTDTFKASYDKSPKLEKISKDTGRPIEDVLREIDRRALILRWVQQKGIRNFKELSPILELYISRPQEVFNTAASELEAKGIAVAEITGEFEPGGQRK